MQSPSNKLLLIVTVLFILMLVGLFWSRAILSLVNIGWVVTAILFRKEISYNSSKHWIYWSFFVLFIYLFGWWQQPGDKETYQYLLTLLVYPIACVVAPFVQLYKDRLQLIWLAAGAISLLYPVSWYFLHIQEAHVAYGSGKSLPVFMDNDHVRYGLFLNSVLLVLSVYKGFNQRLRNVLILLLILLIIVMSVRTAWIALIIIVVFNGLFTKATMAGGLYRKLLLILLPMFLIAYLFIPSVKQKVNYSIYDYKMYDTTRYNADFSDGARRTINSIAYRVIQEGNTAVGWAEVGETLEQKFATTFPDGSLKHKWPFNQWLYWWIGAGLIGMILFTLWVLYPAFHSIFTNSYLVVCWIGVILASCVVESTLNFQYGVFLHIWPLLLLRQQDSKKYY